MSASNTLGNFNFKIVLLGEGCVGKTSLLLRYIEDKFHDQHKSTIQASFLNKKLNIYGKRVNLSIWDTAGQERFHALGPIYYRSSNGAILVYDITDEDSFQKLGQGIEKVLGSDICLMIAGNKIDLEKDRNVSVENAESYASSVGALHFQTSAKLNEGIEELFVELTKQMIERVERSERKDNPRRSRVVIVDDDVTTQGGCCSSSSQHS